MRPMSTPPSSATTMSMSIHGSAASISKLCAAQRLPLVSNLAKTQSSMPRRSEEHTFPGRHYSRRFYEHGDSWLRRINQQAMRGAALAAGLELGENSVFDAQEMVKISQKIIEEAWSEGNCVIVGRGAQCVLQHKPDVFH